MSSKGESGYFMCMYVHASMYTTPHTNTQLVNYINFDAFNLCQARNLDDIIYIVILSV